MRIGGLWSCLFATALAASTLVPAVSRAQAASPEGGLAVSRESRYAAGNLVELTGPVNGDAVLAGRRVRISGPVGGDILAAGWNVTLSGQAHDDVRIAGGDVLVDGPVDGDLTAAGGDVTLTANARVAGRAWVSGGTVRVDGQFDRELQIAAGTVQLGGEIRQPIRLIAERVEVLPGARILAGLDYRSPQPAQISDKATVAGPVTFTQIQKREAERAHGAARISSLFFIVQVFFLGALLVIVLPALTTATVTTLRREPGTSLLLGFVLAVTVPVAALLLMVSIFGLPVGVVIAALFAIALLAGLVTTALLLGEIEIRTLGRRLLGHPSERLAFLFAGVLTIGIARMLPLVGGWVVLVSVLFGLGALGLWLYRNLRPQTPMQPA